MAKGKKTGGRTAGTANKKTQDLLDKCAKRGVDPFDVLLEYAATGTDDQRIAAAKELCQYLYPKRKAIEKDIDPAIAEAYAALKDKNEKELLEIIESAAHTDPVSTES